MRGGFASAVWQRCLLPPRAAAAAASQSSARAPASQLADASCCCTHVLQEYGSGRARLPGLADMPGLQGALNSGGASSGKGSSNNGSNGRDSRNNGSSNGSSPGGAAGSIENAATLAEYLRFGRLIGESPQQVPRGAALAALPHPAVCSMGRPTAPPPLLHTASCHCLEG